MRRRDGGLKAAAPLWPLDHVSSWSGGLQPAVVVWRRRPRRRRAGEGAGPTLDGAPAPLRDLGIEVDSDDPRRMLEDALGKFAPGSDGGLKAAAPLWPLDRVSWSGGLQPAVVLWRRRPRRRRAGEGAGPHSAGRRPHSATSASKSRRDNRRRTLEEALSKFAAT